ncbi:CCA tRNA nucleotidyltransferase [Caldalkalibacillus thermarum TA2.A1]|uniref:CCA-adding enzyme n=2 Tax=Caldalkalibacillus TaxID=379065 RepID=A0A8X8L9A8_CALTT|nr:CCA tRNA nucleotidyltransferase [Caldalkalibacillus thermarum TA2.A1]
MIDMKLMRTAKRILEKLESHGYEAYMVGGCVRDFLLKLPVQDIDICTSARPEQVMNMFERTVPTGLKHGTVTVVEAGIPFEVTTFRTEQGYSDYRRPDWVHFVDSLRQDLSRRDFTINAMAMDRFGRIYDYFDGQRDLKRKVIRTVGEPEDRFEEDALRMFRAVHFSGQLGFSVEPEVLNAIQNQRQLLEKVARERITQEFQKLMQAPFVEHGLRTLISSRIATDIPPFCYIQEGLNEASRYSMQGLTEPERWALLLCHVPGEHRMQFLRGLRLTKKFVKKVKRLLDILDSYESIVQAEQIPAYDLICLGEEDAVSLLKLNQLRFTQSLDINVEQQVKAVLKQLPIRHPQELCVNGKDLQTFLNRPPGPWIQKALNRLAKAVVEGKVANDPEQIRAYVMEDEHDE